MISRSFAKAAFVAAIVAASGSLAFAQAAQQPQAPIQPNETKQVGDWQVRCYPVKSASPCDMFEALADKKTGRRWMTITVAYLPVADRHVIQIAVPLGVSFASGLQIHTDQLTSQPLYYRRCDRGGCYVETLVDNGSIDGLMRSTSDSLIRFTLYNGKAVNLSFSLNGFAEAHNTLVQLAKARSAAATADDASGAH